MVRAGEPRVVHDGTGAPRLDHVDLRMDDARFICDLTVGRKKEGMVCNAEDRKPKNTEHKSR